MKTAIISDIHQSVYWRQVIDKKDDYEKIIFLGDEFDNWDNKWPLQMNNAEDIIAFKKENPDKVDLCWSNHAISYFLNERCSGFQVEHAIEITEFYKRNKELFNVVYIYDNWIFSHGGVSAEWMRHCGLKNVHEINTLFREKPNFFRWIGPDGYGNNAKEGPLWIRPEALINNHVIGYNQATGHTEHVQLRIIRRFNQIFVFCDNPHHNYLTVLDSASDEINFINLINNNDTPEFQTTAL